MPSGLAFLISRSTDGWKRLGVGFRYQSCFSSSAMSVSAFLKSRSLVKT